MNITEILDDSTHFRISGAGISFGRSDVCGNCGAEVFVDWSPWITFDNVSTEDAKLEAVDDYGMIEVTNKYPNEAYYSEDTDSNEACNDC